MLIPILTTLALCELSARDDNRQIERHLPIHHGVQWWIRALVVVGVCLLCGVPWLSIGLAGLFSAVFRWRLNRLRGLDWRYIAPWSNYYDRLWIAPFYGLRPSWFDLILIRDNHISFGHHGFIHRAGTIAYIFEGLVFAGVLTLHLI